MGTKKVIHLKRRYCIMFDYHKLSRTARKPVFRVSDHLAVKPQKIARGLEIRIKGCTVYGADQLRDYCAADLRLCFSKCKKHVFS